MFLRWTEKLGPAKSTYQIKEKQVNFLLENIENNFEEHKKAVKLRGNQLAEARKVLKGAKSSYNSLAKENKKLKEYIINIKQRFNNSNNNKNFCKIKNIFRGLKKDIKK